MPTTFDRETLLDLTVNAIPLGILLFFVVVFAVYSPWGFEPVAMALQFSIVILMFGGLALLTYYAGKAISEAEEGMEESPETGGYVGEAGGEQGTRDEAEREGETAEE